MLRCRPPRYCQRDTLLDPAFAGMTMVGVADVRARRGQFGRSLARGFLPPSAPNQRGMFRVTLEGS